MGYPDLATTDGEVPPTDVQFMDAIYQDPFVPYPQQMMNMPQISTDQIGMPLFYPQVPQVLSQPQMPQVRPIHPQQQQQQQQQPHAPLQQQQQQLRFQSPQIPQHALKHEERQVKRRRPDSVAGPSLNSARLAQESVSQSMDGVEVSTSQDTTADVHDHSHSFEEAGEMALGHDFEPPESFAPSNMPDLIQYAGQMLMVGLTGDKATNEIKQLITKYRIGSVILSSRNMKGMLYYFFFFVVLTLADAESTRALILDLQRTAHEAGHEYPLMIAIDQENGMLNNLYDQKYLTQFPGNMAIVATQSTRIAKEVAEATGEELKALGVNWILGPVVDVLTNSANRLLGVRTMGDDPQQVSDYALAFLEGYRAAGMATCGKHFPGYGSATVDTTLGCPIVPESIEQLETASLIPFRKIIKAKIDSIMVGGCALPKVTMNDMHACLSEQVVQQMLRSSMGHDGVVVSECLEMKTLYENVGVRQGTVMAAMAGCDVIIVCSSFKLQLEAISGIFGAVRDEIINEKDIRKAAERVMNMKRRHLSWEKALNPPPLSDLLALKRRHAELANTAYQKSITVLRDHAKYLPLGESVEPDGDILLLTPLVSPIVQKGRNGQSLSQGSEDVFKGFGRAMTKLHGGKIMHASYTANGFKPPHDMLLDQAKAVIVVTTDANRNLYQVRFTKYVGLLCSQQRKPMIAIAASSPYDLALDRAVGTYLCIYEFTQESLGVTARVLFGDLNAVGKFPGSGLYQSRINDRTKTFTSRQRWLVEKWDCKRDLRKLKDLWENCFPDRRFGMRFDVFAELFKDTPNGVDNAQTHFIVRNSSTKGLYGFCATWVHADQNVGCIMMLFVAPSRRGMSIGQSLHERAVNYLRKERKVLTIRLGSRVPSFFEGIPLSSQFNRDITDNMGQPLSSTLRASGSDELTESGASGNSLWSRTSSRSDSSLVENGNVDLVEWFRHAGWDIASGRRSSSDTSLHTHTLLLSNLQGWTVPPKVGESVAQASREVTFTKCRESQVSALLELVERESGRKIERAGIPELYRKAISPGSQTIVMVAHDRDNEAAVRGGVVLFTQGSRVAPLMPWILEFDDARVGGICGLVVCATATSNAEHADRIKQGLVTHGVTVFKSEMSLDRCAMSGVEGDSEASRMRECGFGAWRTYLEVSGLRS